MKLGIAFSAAFKFSHKKQSPFSMPKGACSPALCPPAAPSLLLMYPPWMAMPSEQRISQSQMAFVS
jgi:hypothetical protein